MEVAENKLKLDGDAGTTYTLEKVRFVVKTGAVLRVEVPVEFTGGDEVQYATFIVNTRAV